MKQTKTLMKRIVRNTTLVLAAMAMSSFAVAQKGSLYIGGVAGFASNKNSLPNGTETTSSSWAFGPEAGTFLKDDIQLGLALGISGGKSEVGTTTVTSTNINPTVYGRKFFKITDSFSAFGGLYLTYISGSSTVETGTTSTEYTQSGFGARFGIGVAYALSPRFAMVGQYGLLGYSSVKNKMGGTETGTDSHFDFGVNSTGSSTLSQGNGSGAVFNIGLYYTFKQ